MKLYADTPARRARQVMTDLLVLAWLMLCVVVGRLVHSAVLTMLSPAQQIRSAGSTFGTAMRQAQQAVGGVPLVGDQLAQPFREAAGAGTSVSDAGRRLGEAVGHLATLLGVLTALLPALLVVVLWLVARIRFARRAGAVRRLLASPAENLTDLLALRAIARQPVQRLAAVAPDPSGAWRRGDRDVVLALARLELADAGLRLPSRRS